MDLPATNNTEISNASASKLWIELKKGNSDALNVLFYTFYNDLYFYGIKLVNDNNLIIDTIQDVFSILWENKKKLSDVQNVRAYIFTIFRNKLLKVSQKNINFFSLDDISKIPEKEFIISQEDLIIEKETKSQISKSISAILEDLTDKQKEILYLKFYCNLSNTEICQTLQINKQSVSNLLNRSINTFRKKLEKYDLSLLLTIQILINHLSK